MEWLIPLLMFAFPVAIALLDKRAKKRKGIPQVLSRPVFPPASSGSGARPEKRPTLSDPSQPFGWAPPSYDAEGGTVSHGRLPDPTVLTQATPSNKPAANNPSEEGQRAISKERRKATETKKVNPGQKLEIDKKKLIIYSEILKPKFDA